MKQLRVEDIDVLIAGFDETGSLPPLTPDDVGMLERYENQARRREKEISLSAVRQLFADNKALISHAPDGHPFVEGYSGSLSISHSSSEIAVAYSRTRIVGIDVERWRPALLRVRKKFLSESEMLQWTGDTLLLRAWTIKEAVYKAALIKGLSLFAIHLPDPRSENPVAQVITENGGCHSFSLLYLNTPSAAVTLAIRE